MSGVGGKKVLFGLKRRSAVPTSAVFEDDDDREQDQEADEGPLAQRPRLDLPRLEDPLALFRRLRKEAEQLAEEGKFWQSVSTFDRALEIDSDGVGRRETSEVKEMKAQALMQVSFLFN